MKAFLNLAGSSLALALASTAASAQTAVTRSINAEPVETTVTQTPTGTIVTRRPVAQQPALIAPRTVDQSTIVQPTVRALVENSVDAITTREVVRRAEAERAAPRLTTREVSAPRPSARHVSARQGAHKVRHTTRTATTRATQTAGVAPRLVLAPRERQIVYQTIVERQVVPRQQVIVATGVAPAPAFVAPRVVQPPIVAADEVAVPAPITVGTVLPTNVPLYAIPENVALSVPATQSYSYAYLGGRAYLVEPASGTVVADVTK